MRVQVDTSPVDEALKFLTNGLVRPASRLALNDSGRKGRTAGRKEIRAKWNLKAGFISERVDISSFASEADLSLILQARGRAIDLTHFGARWVRGNKVLTRQGKSVGTKVLKRRSRSGGVFYTAERGKKERIPNAFIARVTAGKSDTHVGVFVRSGKKRLPITKKKVISIPSMFEQDRVYQAIERVVAETFPLRFDHHVDRAIAKRFGK